MTIHFNNSLIVSGAVNEKKRSFNTKEAEAYEILYALRKARDFGHHKTHSVYDTQEVINAIN